MVDDVPPSVVIAVRDRPEEFDRVFESLMPLARATNAEVIVVGAVQHAWPEGVRLIHVDDDDLFRLRMIGANDALGHVVAIGEDHAVPRPDWCAAMIVAHSEHPDVPGIVGCLMNGTASTRSGRANFLAFAGPFRAPMPELPAGRVPPLSCLSFKRSAFGGSLRRSGDLETDLLPTLYRNGELVADDRIVVDHYQDHGIRWTVCNSFHSARSSYGPAEADRPLPARVREAWWSIRYWPLRMLAGSRSPDDRGSQRVLDQCLVVAIGLSAAAGAVAGLIAGPGRSPSRVA